MSKYTKIITNADKLLAGASTGVHKIGDDLDVTVGKLRGMRNSRDPQVRQGYTQTVNEIINNLDNVISQQDTSDVFNTEINYGVELFMHPLYIAGDPTQLLFNTVSKTYEFNKGMWVPTEGQQYINEPIPFYLYTNYTNYWPLQYNETIIAGAFTETGAKLNSFMTDYVRGNEKAIKRWMYNVVYGLDSGTDPLLKSPILYDICKVPINNTITDTCRYNTALFRTIPNLTDDAVTPDIVRKTLGTILQRVTKMRYISNANSNIGLSDTAGSTTAFIGEAIPTATDKDEFVLLIPNTINNIFKTQAYANSYHNEFVDVEKNGIKVVVIDDVVFTKWSISNVNTKLFPIYTINGTTPATLYPQMALLKVGKNEEGVGSIFLQPRLEFTVTSQYPMNMQWINKVDIWLKASATPVPTLIFVSDTEIKSYD